MCNFQLLAVWWKIEKLNINLKAKDMKKLLSFILVFCTVVFVSAQEVVGKAPVQGEVIPNTHWSVSLKGGGSYFRTGECCNIIMPSIF